MPQKLEARKHAPQARDIKLSLHISLFANAAGANEAFSKKMGQTKTNQLHHKGGDIFKLLPL